jgi:hypothetical protein
MGLGEGGQGRGGIGTRRFQGMMFIEGGCKATPRSQSYQTMGGITNYIGPLRIPDSFYHVMAILFLLIKILGTIIHTTKLLAPNCVPSLQCPVVPHRSCPLLKCLVAHGCAMRWTPYFDISAGRVWPRATCH